MDIRPFALLLFLSLSSTHLHAPPVSADDGELPSPSTTPAPAPSNTDFDFVRETCNATLYPDVCYSALSRYASSVGQSPSALARFSLTVSLSEARLASSYFSNLSRSDSSYDSASSSSALRDCSSTLSSAASQIRSSFKQMCQLGSVAGVAIGRQDLRFRISSVQTWMSAALTNEETCTDGFRSLSDGPLKSDVFDRVTNLKMLTSIALALVNNYASTVN